ncbi:MAG: hypothetical protein K2M73_07675 [Lachnospiraceae bacterium]|nr:hypothetical protein [Lachnospiraceae bacterium]
MENSLKGLILAAGTIITCVVISLGFFISREAKDTAANGANQINRLNAEFLESDKTIYDGATVSGSEVINVIKRFADEKLSIYVKTNKSSTFYGYMLNMENGNITGESNNSISIAYNEENSAYINPYANFKGMLIRDENNVITGISFTQ